MVSEVADVITLELIIGHPHAFGREERVFLQKLRGRQELALGNGIQVVALDRLQLIDFREKTIAEWLLWVVEDHDAEKPGRGGQGDQQKDKNSPPKQPAVAPVFCETSSSVTTKVGTIM